MLYRSNAVTDQSQRTRRYAKIVVVIVMYVFAGIAVFHRPGAWWSIPAAVTFVICGGIAALLDF
jgi:hypothetical protein